MVLNLINLHSGRYTTLDDSDSDDIVELLPPPTKPVGPRQDTGASGFFDRRWHRCDFYMLVSQKRN